MLFERSDLLNPLRSKGNAKKYREFSTWQPLPLPLP